jgi:hypothetical protein
VMPLSSRRSRPSQPVKRFLSGRPNERRKPDTAIVPQALPGVAGFVIGGMIVARAPGH